MFASVRARLTLWYTAVVAVVLVAFSVVAYALLARAIYASTDASLAGTGREIAIEAADGAEELREIASLRYAERTVAVFDANARLLAMSQPPLAPAEQRAIAAVVRSGARGLRTIAGGREHDGIRLFLLAAPAHGAPLTVVVAHDLDPESDRLEDAARALLLGIPLALLAAAAGGYLLARKALAPVTAMSAQARQIGAENLGDRIAVVNERDELGYLATTLNNLLERLEQAFASQRRFMADASHELRTPVAIVQGEADVALSRERTADEYRESIRIMQRASSKLTRIVSDLFLLARTDAGQYPIVTSRFYLDELLAGCVRSMKSVADARQVTLACACDAELVMCGDEELLERLFLNLIHNAVKFTPACGTVTIAAALNGAGRYVINVADTGLGIAAEDQPKIFERFFRADRGRGGAGFGLPIARWIAEAHGGRVVLERSGASGSTFAVVLPAVVAPDASC